MTPLEALTAMKRALDFLERLRDKPIAPLEVEAVRREAGLILRQAPTAATFENYFRAQP